MKRISLSISLAVVLSGCVTTGEVGKQTSKQPLNISATSFSNLSGWRSDSFREFSSAYQKSCNAVLKRNSQSEFGKKEIFGKNQEWQILCRKFNKIDKNSSSKIRSFFENNFVPYQVKAGSNSTGIFTGYYEAALKGSLTRKGPYQYPLRARPSDLVMVNLGEFRDELKGQRIAGRVKGGKLKPYETHAEIIAGKMPKSQDKTLVWVDSAVDAFFIQIQGSGIVTLDNGRLMRVGYAGQNGHPYYAIGRELVKRGELAKRDVSMQSIRAWLDENPDQAQELMQTNKSYVFFKELDGEGPVGGQGVSLTAMRSLAIDHSLVPYGMPVWVDLEPVVDGGKAIQRLMVTQDTGGAIRGPVRGDFFWGYGAKAEEMAGAMNSKGRYWFLLPK